MIQKPLVTLLVLLMAGGVVNAQNFGPSDPSPEVSCGEFQWPEVQSPCPEVQIKQKHDHTPIQEYRERGWDTAVTCTKRMLTLSCMPYIPVQYFNGQYTVDTIPYDPVDTTFWMNGQGTKQDITSDDRFAPSSVTFDFPFYFFGYRKNQFRIGDNGIVTFCTDSSYNKDSPSPSNGCPWSFSSGIPWKSSQTPEYSGSCFNRMHDAIYGVYEDTYTGVDGEYLSGNQGIYYGVIGEYPCRKIIATWNEIPVFSDEYTRETYQIVAYEGSNIVEVHIRERNGGYNGSSTNTGRGIIGIQNATGVAQEPGGEESITANVKKGSPAAFYPSNRNNYSDSETKKAYRFTPQGYTAKTYEWFRLLDNGDTIRLGTDPNNPNGYMSDMGETSTCPTLTKAYVSPTEVSRYVFHMRFRNANLDDYDLYDTITIGIDTANNTYLHPSDKDSTVSVMNICQGKDAQLYYTIPSVQKPTTVIFNAWRVSMGQQIALDTNASLTIGEMQIVGDVKRQSITLNGATLPTTGLMSNKIDSVYVKVSTDYASGCTNYDEILVRIFPNFDTTETVKICNGEQYIWSANGKAYATTSYETVSTKSTPGCDSVVHLDLTVLDVSHTTDYIEDCKPITWINGVTYETSNTATVATDTVKLTNAWGCDSIVHLSLNIYPLEARIQASRKSFNFDNLEVELNDISTGASTRLWRMPGGLTSNSSTTWFTMPTNLDSAEIWLIARSQYGCVDSAHIVIPLRKETFWVPSAFNPEGHDANSTFGSVSYHTLSQQMYIYNRMGMLVFQCEGVDCQWDGRDLNGNKCPQGSYVYFIRYNNDFEPLRFHTLKGTVTLIR